MAWCCFISALHLSICCGAMPLCSGGKREVVMDTRQHKEQLEY